MIRSFSAGGSQIGVGLLSMIVTFSFATIAIAECLLMVKVSEREHCSCDAEDECSCDLVLLSGLVSQSDFFLSI